MGERTVREVLKRRSEETLRKIQVRRNKNKVLKERRRGRGLFLKLLLLVIVAGLAWCGWLAWRAQAEFRAHEWVVPARVYARALELFPGRELSSGGLVAELQRLGYARRATPDAPGTYAADGGRVRFVTRAFRFWDGDQPSLDRKSVV